MVKRKLSELLDELDSGKKQGFWHTKLNEMLVLLKEKRYSALERRIKDLLESDKVTGRIKPPKTNAQKNSAE